jgi:Glutaredoxin-like domain (DUF836)
VRRRQLRCLVGADAAVRGVAGSGAARRLAPLLLDGIAGQPSSGQTAPVSDARAPDAADRAGRITVLVRARCHLCDEALTVVREVAARLDERVDVVDIDAAGDPDLLDRYTEQVPVTLIDGNVHDFWRVDADRLTAALTRRR